MANRQHIKAVLESLLFVWGDPLEAKVCADLLGYSVPEMIECFRELAGDYELRESGLRIREMDKQFQLCTNPENDDYIRKLSTPVKERRLTQAALEVLAIVAYRQPVTKGEVDSIRGVRSDRAIEGLLRRELIEEVGRSDAIGRPILYGTTTIFLAQFGFESLADLPNIEEIGGFGIHEELEYADELSLGQMAILLDGEEKADTV